MKTVLSILFCSQFLVFLTGCNNHYKPYRVERTEFISRVKTLGIMPVYLDEHLEEEKTPVKEEAKIEIEKAIEARLKDAGFAVVPASDFRAIQNSIQNTLGISITEPNDPRQLEKYDMVMEHTKREYFAKHKVDALVRLQLIAFRANWYGNNASWCGATEPVTGKKGLWESFVASNYRGYVPAMSLKVVIHNTDEKIYYVNYGGIQLLKHLNAGFGESFPDVPKDKILSDPKRIANAVEIACVPIQYEHKDIPNKYKIYFFDEEKKQLDK